MEEKNYQHNDKKPDHRLKKNNQFNYIFKKGDRVHTKNFNLYVVKSKYKTYKIGYSIPKKEGKANKRNLLRRRLKEIVRLNDLAKVNHNYIIQAKNGASLLEFKEIESQIIKLFKRYEESSESL